MLSVGTSVFKGLEVELQSPFPAGSLVCLAVGSSDQDGSRDSTSLPPLLCDLQHVPNLSVHSLHSREKSSSVSSQAIVMVNMLLIVMNSYWSCRSHISIWDKWQAAHRKGPCTKAFTGRTASFTSCWALLAADHNEQLRPWSWRIDILCTLFLSSWWNRKCYLTTS